MHQFMDFIRWLIIFIQSSRNYTELERAVGLIKWFGFQFDPDKYLAGHRKLISAKALTRELNSRGDLCSGLFFLLNRALAGLNELPSIQDTEGVCIVRQADGTMRDGRGLFKISLDEERELTEKETKDPLKVAIYRAARLERALCEAVLAGNKNIFEDARLSFEEYLVDSGVNLDDVPLPNEARPEEPEEIGETASPTKRAKKVDDEDPKVRAIRESIAKDLAEGRPAVAAMKSLEDCVAKVLKGRPSRVSPDGKIRVLRLPQIGMLASKPAIRHAEWGHGLVIRPFTVDSKPVTNPEPVLLMDGKEYHIVDCDGVDIVVQRGEEVLFEITATKKGGRGLDCGFKSLLEVLPS